MRSTPRGRSPTVSCRPRSTGAHWACWSSASGPGDVVSFQLPNWIELLVLHFAATRIGAVSNPLIPIYRDREVGFMVGLAESKVLVVPREFRGFDYVSMVDRLRPTGRNCSTCSSSTANPASESVLGVVHGHTVGGTPRPGRARRAAPGPQRGHAADVHLRDHRRAQGCHAHPQHGRRGQRAAARAARRQQRQRHPHGLDPRAPHRLPLWRPPADADRCHRCLPGRVGHRAVRRTHRAARDHLHLGGDTVPARHAQRPEPRRARRVLAGPVLLHGRPDPAGHRPPGQGALARLAVLGGWGQTENALVTLGIPGDPEEKIVDRDGYPCRGCRSGSSTRRHLLPADTEGRLQVRGRSCSSATPSGWR